MQQLLSLATQFGYGFFLKPLLFTQDPEVVHNHMVSLGKKLGRVQWLSKCMKWAWSYSSPRTSKKIDGILFPNPVGLAAGFDYNADLIATLPAVGFGFNTVGTVTFKPYQGNPPPRLTRFPDSHALLVNKGLKNEGAVAIIKKLKTQNISIPLGISIASTNKEYKSEAEQISDIMHCFKLFETSGLSHSFYELNISCPNTFGGEPFTTATKLERLMKKMDKLTLSRPLYIKMPIDQNDKITLQLLKVLSIHNTQGVIFGNLTKDKTNPAVKASDRARWQVMRGNVSGKPTESRSNHCISLTKKHFGTRFTIIGTGGIFSGADAATKFKLGADLVQLVTGMIYQGPQLIGQINRDLDR